MRVVLNHHPPRQTRQALWTFVILVLHPQRSRPDSSTGRSQVRLNGRQATQRVNEKRDFYGVDSPPLFVKSRFVALRKAHRDLHCTCRDP